MEMNSDSELASNTAAWDMASGKHDVTAQFRQSDSEAVLEVAARGSSRCVGGDSQTHLLDLHDGTVSVHPFGEFLCVANRS